MAKTGAGQGNNPANKKAGEKGEKGAQKGGEGKNADE